MQANKMKLLPCLLPPPVPPFQLDDAYIVVGCLFTCWLTQGLTVSGVARYENAFLISFNLLRFLLARVKMKLINAVKLLYIFIITQPTVDAQKNRKKRRTTETEMNTTKMVK